MNSLKHMLPLLPSVLILGLTGMMTSVGQTEGDLRWPDPYIAPDVRLSSIGGHININGVPSRIYRFTTESKPDEVVTYFRAHVERDFVRAAPSAALEGQTAVAGRMGDYWVTLQLQQQQQSGETVGTWSATPRFRPGVRQETRLPTGFPATATLTQQIDSFDDDKSSQLAVGVDPGPVDGVAERLGSTLHDQGFVKQTTSQATWPQPNVYIATFRKGREEVLVTLKQEPQGTLMMINRISALEELK
jgi:hypothetical protein